MKSTIMNVVYPYMNDKDAFIVEDSTTKGNYAVGYFRNADFTNGPMVANRAELYLVSVNPNYRRRGIGLKLAKTAVEFCSQQGAITINVHPVTPNGKALVLRMVKGGIIGKLIQTSITGKSEYFIGL